MYIIFTSEQQATQCESNIHEWLTANRPGYNAEKWADLQKHPEQDLWAFPLPPETLDLIQFDFETIETLPEDWNPVENEE